MNCFCYSDIIFSIINYNLRYNNMFYWHNISFILILGIFLIPYFLVMIFCGIPLLYLELAIGQFTKRGPIGAISKLCPILKGK